MPFASIKTRNQTREEINMKVAIWYPTAAVVNIPLKRAGSDGTHEVNLRAMSWDSAVRLARLYGADEIKDTLGRWHVSTRRTK